MAVTVACGNVVHMTASGDTYSNDCYIQAVAFANATTKGTCTLKEKAASPSNIICSAMLPVDGFVFYGEIGAFCRGGFKLTAKAAGSTATVYLGPEC